MARPGHIILGAAVVVACLLIAPAWAGAEQLWWFDHREGRFPTAELPKEAEPNLAPLEIKDGNGNLYGPCEELKTEGIIYSEIGGMGEGAIFGVSNKSKKCATSIKNCSVKKIEPLVEPAWTLTLMTDESVQLSSFSVTLELEGECKGAPAKEMTISGDVESGADFISFNGEDPARIAFTSAPVGASGASLEGEIRFGTELTALTEPEGFVAATSPATLDGQQLTAFTLTRSGRTIECSGAVLAGVAETGASTVSVSPSYSGCKTMLGPATVKMNGCEYLLHLEPELVEGVYVYLVSTDLICPTGKAVELDVYSSAANHTAGLPTCHYTLAAGENAGLGTVELTNKAAVLKEPEIPAGWLEAHVDIAGLSSKRTVGGLLLCGGENDAAGTLKGAYQITGTAEGEQPNGIGVFP